MRFSGTESVTADGRRIEAAEIARDRVPGAGRVELRWGAFAPHPRHLAFEPRARGGEGDLSGGRGVDQGQQLPAASRAFGCRKREVLEDGEVLKFFFF